MTPVASFRSVAGVDEAGVEGGGVRVDLERRSDPAPPERVDASEVDLAADRGIVVVGAPDHREDLAIVRVHHQHRAGVHAARRIGPHPRLDPFVSDRLRAEVERGRDPKTSLIHRLLAIAGRYVLLDVVDEVRSQRVVLDGQMLTRRDHLVDQVAAEDVDRRRRG